MEKIDIGTYVRECGKIRKVKAYKIDSDFIKIYYDKGKPTTYNKNNVYIIDASNDLKDLIEEGDIIRYDINTSIEKIHCVNEVDKSLLEGIKKDKNFELKGIILTREQVEKNEYKLEE